MIDNNGIEILLDGSTRTYVDVKTVRRSIALMLKRMNVPSHQVGEVLGVSRRTITTMTSGTSSKVPPVLGVVFGSGEWTPECQDQDPAICSRCGGDSGIIRKGSRLYCAACHKTGFEKRLEKERIDEIFQEAIAAECEAHERKVELAKRRKNRKK